MSESIRIERHEKRVEVNDKGECIVFRVSDPSFISALLDLAGNFEEFHKQQSEKIKQIEESKDGEKNTIQAAVNLNLELSQQMAGKINALFDEDACKKIFGSDTPSLVMLADFFEQIEPLVKKFAEEENAYSQQRVRKYSQKYVETKQK